MNTHAFRKAIRLAAIGAALLPCAASAQYSETRINRATDADVARPHSPQTVRPIVTALIAQNCGNAVKALRTGLKEKHSEVMIMAGTMYERGLCVKKDWNQANDFYLMADAAGNEHARSKLVAGLVGQGDAGGALYWLSKLPRTLPEQCYGKIDADKDPDAFAAELNKWTKARLDGCLYMAGVYHAIRGDMRFPAEASSIGVWGSIRMKFVPASGSVEWTLLNHETRVLEGLQTVEPDTPLAHRAKADQILVKHGKLVSDQALPRFVKPAGIPPEIVIADTFEFDFR